MATTFEAHLAAAVNRTLAEAVRIAEIPAPTFAEDARARYVEERLAAIGGWASLTRDRMGNVVALHRGEAGRSRVLAAAHLDTVFPDATVSIRRQRGKLLGPGIGDNSLSVAALLAVAEALQAAPPRGAGDILLAANVGEEGRGDLRGIRAVCKSHAGQFDRVLAIEGLARDRVQLGFVGSNRYEITVTTEGGHSWGAYGRPNAIALLARALTALEPLYPAVGIEPKTTMSIGVIHGGRSVNTIAPEATAEIDLRSEDPNALAALDAAMKQAVRAAIESSEGQLTVKRIGRRPAGSISQDDPLVQAVLAARRESGLEPPMFNSGSTDANHAIGLGIPATCVGVTTGGEAHTPREWINTAPVAQGLPYLGRAIVNAARLDRT
ncbi:MAG: M20/M25/M40 family metallo-hydrolase [Chloroflexi bacterium]|nr:M20/M25/M40 family metallo-hydrolase [Chloroflexota bacterium]MDA1147616.1 M20/M25/M40 family metallo-hydrolase [Chloroflexota bacterium]